MVGVTDARQLSTMQQAVAMQREVGIRTKMVDVEDLHELEPGMDLSEIVAGCYDPESGYADAMGTVSGFLK